MALHDSHQEKKHLSLLRNKSSAQRGKRRRVNPSLIAALAALVGLFGTGLGSGISTANAQAQVGADCFLESALTNNDFENLFGLADPLPTGVNCILGFASNADDPDAANSQDGHDYFRFARLEANSSLMINWSTDDDSFIPVVELDLLDSSGESILSGPVALSFGNPQLATVNVPTDGIVVGFVRSVFDGSASTGHGNYRLDVNAVYAVPEPNSAVALLALGVARLTRRRRRRDKS